MSVMISGRWALAIDHYGVCSCLVKYAGESYINQYSELNITSYYVFWAEKELFVVL